MSTGLYGGGGGSSPAAGAAGQPGWWGMAAGQLAVQDYLSRVQAAAQEPAQAGKAFQHLKLPSDTEIVPSQGAASKTKGTESDSSSVSIPNIPPGLTIERKKPGRKPLDPNYHLTSSGQVIDRVEITKIPLANGSSAAPLDMSSKSRATESQSSEGEAPLNLSMRTESDSPISLTTKRKDEAEKERGQQPRSKIPSDYYACKSAIQLLLREWRQFCFYLLTSGRYFWDSRWCFSSSSQRSLPGWADPAAAVGLGTAEPPAELQLQPGRHAGAAHSGGNSSQWCCQWW